MPPVPTPSAIARYSRYTQWPTIVETFALGFVADRAPVALPPGAVTASNDLLFDLPGVARKRGGTAYQSNAFGGATFTSQIAWAPFTAGPKLVTVAPGGSASAYHIYDATGGSSVDAGAGGSVGPQQPVFYNDALWVIHGGSGGVPKKVTNVAGTVTLADMGGSPPAATVACTHGGYLILANTSGNPNRLWFSPIPDPEAAWDTADAYIDTAAPIIALASIGGVLIVFHYGSIERVIGSVPPGTVGENMSLQPLSGQVGCIDPRWVVQLGGNVYFGDTSGAWITNGASVTAVSSKQNGMGIGTFWRERMASFPPSTYQVAAGSFGSEWVFFLMSGNLAVVGHMLSPQMFVAYHVPTGTWSPIGDTLFSGSQDVGGGINCRAFTTSSTTSNPETYGAFAGDGRAIKMSDVFTYPPANAGDVTTGVLLSLILPAFTTRPLGEGPSLKIFGHGHVTYDLEGSSPSIAVTNATGVEQRTFTAVAEGATLATTTDAVRSRFIVNLESQTCSLRFAQTNPSTKTEIYAVEIEYRPYGNEADGQ